MSPPPPQEATPIVGDMATARIEVTFDGDVLENGSSMDARAFASSLLGLADAYGTAAKHLYPNEKKPTVNIASPREGSFIFDVVLADPGWATQLFDTLTGKEATATANVIALAGVVPSAIGLLKWAQGKPLQAEPDQSNPNQVHVNVQGDNNTTIVEANTYLIATDPTFQNQAHDIVAPVTTNPNSSITIGCTYLPQPVQVTSQDAISFPSAAEREMELTPETIHTNQILVVTKPDLRGNSQWQFRDLNDNPISATMADEAFLNRVHERTITFGAGTRLHCETTLEFDGIKKTPKITITHVTGESAPGEQLKAF